MDTAARARMQARIVLVVYRAEMARLARIDISPTDRLEWEDTLRRRSIELLDETQSRLSGGPGSRADALRSLAEARAEIAGPDAV
jgi:hypothetical protein